MDNDPLRQSNTNPRAFAPRYVRDPRSGKTYVQYTEDGQWHEYIPMEQNAAQNYVQPVQAAPLPPPPPPPPPPLHLATPPPAYQRRPNPPAPARVQTAARGGAQARQPSANTQAPAAPRTRQGAGRGRTAGTRNWTIDEDIALVDAVADYRPIGKRMWEELVTPEYQSNAEIMGLPSRDTNALIARWKKLIGTKPPTGDPDLPEVIERAKDLDREIRGENGGRSLDDDAPAPDSPESDIEIVEGPADVQPKVERVPPRHVLNKPASSKTKLNLASATQTRSRGLNMSGIASSFADTFSSEGMQSRSEAREDRRLHTNITTMHISMLQDTIRRLEAKLEDANHRAEAERERANRIEADVRLEKAVAAMERRLTGSHESHHGRSRTFSDRGIDFGERLSGAKRRRYNDEDGNDNDLRFYYRQSVHDARTPSPPVASSSRVMLDGYRPASRDNFEFSPIHSSNDRPLRSYRGVSPEDNLYTHPIQARSASPMVQPAARVPSPNSMLAGAPIRAPEDEGDEQGYRSLDKGKGKALE